MWIVDPHPPPLQRFSLQTSCGKCVNLKSEWVKAFLFQTLWILVNKEGTMRLLARITRSRMEYWMMTIGDKLGKSKARQVLIPQLNGSFTTSQHWIVCLDSQMCGTGCYIANNLTFCLCRREYQMASGPSCYYTGVNLSLINWSHHPNS